MTVLTAPPAKNPPISSSLRSTVVSMTQGAVDSDFVRQADPYRRELLAHCYRMLGSVHDAEDLVQETYLRAWRSFDGFEGRSSLRTWLYRIATRTCLTELEGRGRRALPTDLSEDAADPAGTLAQRHEVSWLEPAPDAMLGNDAADPAAIATSRESTRLALIAALQHLPPRQRAVLLLCEVLKWRAREVAELFDLSTPAVNSILQRARARLEEVSPERDAVAEPSTAEQREMLKRWVEAFENYDVPAIVELVSTDSVWEMPPFEDWFMGAANIGTLISVNCPAKGPGDMRLIPVEANGQPGFGVYMRDPSDGVHYPFALQVLTLTGAGVAHTYMFFELSLFEKFELPSRL